MALNSDYNLRRLERYLSIVWDGGATPVIVLTKSDLCDELNLRLSEVSEIAFGSDIINGYSAVASYIKRGKTIAFIGSSGVGKSTLINLLMGKDINATKEISADGRGRHTTTHRQLMLVPGGGLSYRHSRYA